MLLPAGLSDLPRARSSPPPGMAGAGLLLSDFLRPDTRRTLGWTLLAIGALTTIPIAMALFGKRERTDQL